MSDAQNSLFDETQVPVPSEFKGDLVAQAKASAATPMQREFAKLLASIEQLGAELQTLEVLQSQYRLKFNQTLSKRQAEQQALQKQMVVFLHERLQQPEGSKAKALTASNRKAIGRVIVSFSINFAMQGDQQMREIHDLYSNEKLADQDEEQLEDMRELLAGLGIELPELGDKANALEQARAALSAIQEKMQQAQEIEDQRRAKREQKRQSAKPKKPRRIPSCKPSSPVLNRPRKRRKAR
ncbi:MAG: hypothetical protein HC765_03805 [Brachymonas sp.]|nr:hypothetical protein [Brachymonas sp.]